MSQVLSRQTWGMRSLLPFTLPLMFLAIVLFFAWQAPGFLSGGDALPIWGRDCWWGRSMPG